MNRIAWLILLLALLAAAGCGQPGAQPSPVISTTALPVLATSAVPGISSVTTRLTPADLAKDAAIRGLAAKIASWGYLGGRQRTFQGESHHLTLVISSALIFRDATGAQHYAAFVHEHQAAFFGASVQARRLPGRGVSGWMFVPPLCACHLANPALIGVLTAGTRVLWLEINGPTATPALLMRLLGTVRNAGLRMEQHAGLRVEQHAGEIGDQHRQAADARRAHHRKQRVNVRDPRGNPAGQPQRHQHDQEGHGRP
jgi:hypothetical protein